ncbi:3-oxoacyl-[acyl-carrier-protein] reductase [soil metagenome]
MGFDGKVVVVTGASRGIGRAIASSFAAKGATVACVATTEANAQATVEAIGGQSKAYGCDVSDATAVESTFEKIVQDLGTPAILVTNAGITRDTLMLRMKEEDWDRVIDVNLKGSFLWIRAVTKSMMKARYGRIVNISSVVGQSGAAGQVNYAASKAGIIGMSKAVAKELGSRGITCNVVSPGYIATDMTEALPEEMKEYVNKTAPAGRLGTPEDIAAAVVFLASEEASYITGQALTVDGGLTL